VIAGPGVNGNKECHTPVSLIDLYPTLLDYCKLPGSPNSHGNNRELDGFSLTSLLENPVSGNWEGPSVALTAVCSQQELEVNQPGPEDQQQYSIRSDRYRYISYRNGEEELYDHRYDPYEWFNLASDPSYSVLKGELRHRLEILLSK
jgi:arylsulfatase A-like enzyme